MSIQTLKGVWWKKVDASEKLWLGIALVWCLILFAMMPLWHLKGGQNPSFETYRTTAEQYMKKVDAFVAARKVGEEKGLPVVAPDPGEDVYMLGRLWLWYPVLKLKKGETYRLHLSSVDLVHGFSIFPLNLNFMVLPGYDYVLTVTPTTSGEFYVVCNEFCGIGHHQMVGKILVE
ncbi:MAG: cyoA [candidate division NC10 bacterium]|nr:cyoA [candidate division NC10 bacterium]